MKRDYNYGISLLRTILAFLIVVLHVVAREENPSVIALSLLDLSFVGVPCFMMLAFYYSGKLWDSVNSLRQGFEKRVKRLLIPYLFWPLAVWLLYAVLDAFLGTSLNEGASVLFWNYVIGGQGPMAQLWFQWVLIIWTISFSFFAFLPSKRSKELIVITILFICLFLEYSNLNYCSFIGMSSMVNYTLGRLVEMLVFSCIGYLLYLSNFLEILREKKWFTVLGCVFIWGVSLFVIPFPVVEGFGYQGGRLILLSLSLLIMFYALPLDSMPAIINRIVLRVGNYAMGVYLLHYAVYCLLKQLLLQTYGIHVDSLLLSVIVWIVSIALSVGISHLPGNFFKSIVM